MADLKEEADQRIAEARRQKALVNQDIREAYFVTRPRLSRTILSESPPSQQRPKDDSFLATGVGTEVNEDFATEVIAAFMPSTVEWVRSEPGEAVDDDVWRQVKDQAEADDKTVFKAIRSSNFDAELATALVPDCGVGTVAMFVEDRQAHEPICVQHVPLRELEINIGPYGEVDDRFIVRHIRAGKVEGAFPEISLPVKLTEKFKRRKDAWIETRRCFWRDWTKPEDKVWQSVIQIDGEVVYDNVYRGEGSCPLLVGRFSPDSLHAFGNGPTIDSLPYLRILNAIAEATQDRVDIAMAPPIAYPDDGYLSFEDGIESGKAYPKRPGSSGEIEKLYFEGDPNLGFLTQEGLEKAVRRKHFADYPEQTGDTPPTATQWIDEMMKAQRRIGTPGQKFWRELPSEVFLRYRYLVMKRGIIKPLAVNGRQIAIRPYNPATKAQEQQEVLNAVRLLGILKQNFPATSQAAIDELATAKNFQDKMGDKVLVFRDKAAVNKIVTSMLSAAHQAVTGQQPGGQPGAPPNGASPPGPPQ